MLTPGSRRDIAATVGATRRGPRLARCALGGALLLAAALLPQLPGSAQETVQDGLYISVPNPITEKAVSDIKQRIEEAQGRQQGPPLRVVVFDFNPQDKPSGSSDVFLCMKLKHLIRQLGARPVAGGTKNVLTVAFVHDKVTDHTVLPVLACRDLVMSSKGELGNIRGKQGNNELPPLARDDYQEVAKKRLPERWQTVLDKMLDPSDKQSIYTYKEAQEAGLCTVHLETRKDVQDQYRLSALSMREADVASGTRMVALLEINGAIDGGKLGSLKQRINENIRKKKNLIFLKLDCDGGETEDARAMADYLRTLKDDTGVRPVRTIAYVPPGHSLGAATFLALGCSEIVMAPDARLGGFDYLRGLDAKQLDAKRRMLVDLAREQGYAPAFFHAMLTPGETVWQCQHRAEPTKVGVLTAGELNNRGDWIKGQQIPSAGERGKSDFFSLDARTAKQYGIAHYSDVGDLATLYQRYEVDPAKVDVSRDSWLDQVAAFLREPVVNVLLIMVGIAGLILELKMPGFGIPGIIAAICFVLFFWAHAFAGHSSAQFTVLAILLFVLGIVLLGIEVFLLPGFGVTGVSGIVLIVLSLVLVLLEQMPTNSQEWVQFGGALTTVAVGLVSGLCMAMVVAHYLPNMPYANRLVLQPPTEETDPAAELTAEGLKAAALLGAIGVAATTLRPAGKVQFGEEFVDVVAEGDFVDAGARVQVIEIEGNRIVVKEI